MAFGLAARRRRRRNQTRAMRAARAMHPPMVAPTMAPVGVEDEDEAVEVFVGEEDAEEDDGDDWAEGLDWSDDAMAVVEESEEAVGQPMMVGEVRAQPSMGWAKA